MKRLFYLKNVATLKLNIERCTGCGMCAIVGPHAVFEIKGKKAQILEKNACMECGACAINCPVQAITVRAGVGCATAIIESSIKKTEPSSETSCCDSNRPCC